MKNKKIILLFVILAIAIVSVVLYFISRPQHQEFLPQTFAQLPEKPKLIDEFHQNTRIYSVAFSPADHSLIALADEKGTIKLWNRNIKNKPAVVLNHPGKYIHIGFSPTGKLLASAGYGKLVLWDVASGMEINIVESTREFAFSPDGNQLAIILNGVKLLDIRDPRQIKEVSALPFDETHKVRSWACAIDISPDGKLIAAGYANGNVNVWNLQTKQHVKSLRTPLVEMEFLKFSPDNKFLACGGPQLIIRDNKRWKSHRPWGYIMWELNGWKRSREVQRGHIENLAFSQDGKMCAFANWWSALGNGVKIWSVENGAPITSLPIETRDVAFSQNGKLLATGGEDGIVRVWEFTSQQLEFPKTPSDALRIIYFPGKDKEPIPNITEKIDKSIREAQDFYADEMERHGFGRKTFTFETDENGKAKIYLGTKKQTEHLDLSNGIWLAVTGDSLDISLPVAKLLYTDDNETFEYTSNSSRSVKDNIWIGEIKGIAYGRLVNAKVKDLKWKPLAYVLRGAFALPYIPLQHEPDALKRFFFRVNNKMPWGKKWAKLSKCEAEWLDRSRFLNPNQPFFDKRPKIEMKVSQVDTSDSRLFQFSIADMDGIHQVQLFVPIDIKNQRWRKKFYECQALEGKDKATVEFEISDPEIKTVALRMIDMHGNIASREFRIKDKEP